MRVAPPNVATYCGARDHQHLPYPNWGEHAPKRPGDVAVQAERKQRCENQKATVHDKFAGSEIVCHKHCFWGYVTSQLQLPHAAALNN